MASRFSLDNYDADELAEAIDLGEVGFCEVCQAYDYADNIHGHTTIGESGDGILCCCEDCEGELPGALVTAACRAKVPSEKLGWLVHRQEMDGVYDDELAERLFDVIEAAFPDEPDYDFDDCYPRAEWL